MGLINASITFVIGYVIINIIKKNKDNLNNIPVVNQVIGKTSQGDGVSNDAWFLLAGFVIKDLLI